MRTFFKSFSYAFNGLREMLFVERNFNVHIGAAFLAIAFCVFLQVSDIEFLIVIICIATVIAFENINSAIEKLCDLVHPGHSEKIKVIKDLSAAAVLVAALASFIIGIINFVPKLVELLHI